MTCMAVFDLDGTLIHSLGGIAESVNRTREKFGFPRLPLQDVQAYTGDGARKLLRRSFAKEGFPIPEDDVLKIMLDYYAEKPVYKTYLYPYVMEGLKKLSELGWKLMVLTNKHTLIARSILQHFGIESLFDEILGGDSGFPLKPAPDAIYSLSEKYGIPMQNIWMIGDNHTDLNCAKNAGARGLFCSYGFGKQKDAPTDATAEDFRSVVTTLLTAN